MLSGVSASCASECNARDIHRVRFSFCQHRVAWTAARVASAGRGLQRGRERGVVKREREREIMRTTHPSHRLEGAAAAAVADVIDNSPWVRADICRQMALPSHASDTTEYPVPWTWPTCV